MASPRDRARPLRANETDAERKLWARLRDRQVRGAKFRRRHPIGPFIADFCCPEHFLVIELDGGQHATQADADWRRTEFLARQGYRVGAAELVWRDARRLAVTLVRLIFDVTGRETGRRPLDDLLREISDHGLLSRKTVAYLHTIRTVRTAAEYSPGNEDFHEGDIELVALMVQEVLREGRRRRYW